MESRQNRSSGRQRQTAQHLSGLLHMATIGIIVAMPLMVAALLLYLLIFH